ASSRRSRRRARSATCAPRWASPTPMQRPIPLDAPMTTVRIPYDPLLGDADVRRPGDASGTRSQASPDVLCPVRGGPESCVTLPLDIPRGLVDVAVQLGHVGVDDREVFLAVGQRPEATGAHGGEHDLARGAGRHRDCELLAQCLDVRGVLRAAERAYA